MKKLQHIITSIIMTVFSVGLLSTSPLAESTVSAQVQTGLDAVKTSELDSKKIDGNGGLINTIVNILLWVIGIISVIMIIWSGIRYTTSAGDSNKVTAAKNTLIYAIVGLILAVLSYAIVNFVIARL